jgi:3',5'-cyclic AMP phosphodiesterase CpdA
VTPFRLAHLSDPHLPPPAGALGWRDLASKRLLSGLAWRRKGVQHQPQVLAALIADVRGYAPNHVAVTGDLTNFSATPEFSAARTWLQSLGPASQVTVSPGNHDALVERGAGEPFGPWREWLGDQAGGDFPQVRERDGVALINLCSAVPTALHLATGRLGPDQLGRLEAILDGLAGRRLFRVLMIHHPPAPGAVSGRKALDDAGALRKLLVVHGVDLVLHGHAHEALINSLPGPDGPIPVLGVPSASAAAGGRHAPARWHAIEIGEDRAVRIVARGLQDNGNFEALGSYLLSPAQPA